MMGKRDSSLTLTKKVDYMEYKNLMLEDLMQGQSY